MMVYAIANTKGGVGKTTTSTALASILIEKGYKVLLLDTDSRGSATDTYRANKEAMNLYNVILSPEPVSINSVIQKTKNGDIISANYLLKSAEGYLPYQPKGFFKLKYALQELEGYDYVIIDTPGSANTLLRSALNAADRVIVPITADRYGCQGLEETWDSIVSAQENENQKLDVAGILLTRFSGRTNISRETRDALAMRAEIMGTKVFDVTIRECIKTQDAQREQKHLIHFNRKCTTARDYYTFVDELLDDEKTLAKNKEIKRKMLLAELAKLNENS